MNIQFAASSDKGNRKVNQDVFITCPSPFLPIANDLYRSSSMFAVMDGHGDFGFQSAKYIADHLPGRVLKLFQDHPHVMSDDPLKEVLADMFMTLDREMMDIDVSVDWLDPSMPNCLVANIGDGRVISLSADSLQPLTTSFQLPETETVASNLKISQLSIEHSCESPGEMQRLENAGANLSQLQIGSERTGPLRIFKGTMPYPGLAVSRSMGDSVAKRLGVISTPDVVTLKLDQKSYKIVVGCDGVWDGLSNAEVCKIIANDHMNVQEVSNRLTAESVKALDRVQLDDNVTSICIFIHLE